MISTLVIFLLIALDQISKFYAVKYLQPIRQYPIISNFFHLTYVENRGAAFGILRDKKTFFVIITLIILAVLFTLLYKQKGKFNLLSISLILVIAGAIGNLIDRIRLSYVIDFFDFKFFPAIFNVADIAVVIGTGLLCIYILIDGDFK